MNKIKAIICLVLCAALSFVMCGCSFIESSDDTAKNDDRMTVVYSDGWHIIYRDNETGVQYLEYCHGGTCVMVNPDGTPYTGK